MWGGVHNLRADPRLAIRRGRHEENLIAVELNAEQAAPVLKRYVKQVRITAPYFDASAADAAERFAEEADRHPVFLLRPTA